MKQTTGRRSVREGKRRWERRIRAEDGMGAIIKRKRWDATRPRFPGSREEERNGFCMRCGSMKSD